jgi:hypothetical protein
MELVTGFTIAPGATITGLTAASGNTFQIRNAKLEAQVWLLNVWADAQAAGILRLRSPRLHDNVQGIRVRTTISEVEPYLPWSFPQKLISQDTLAFELSGSAVGGDIESASFLALYEDLPGVEARYISYDELKGRMRNVIPVEVSNVAGLTGGYSGEVALNSSFDLLKANTDYALLGYQVSGECCSVGIRGVDSGNLRIGGPGNDVLKHLTGNWFVNLSRKLGRDLVPVFNSANKAGILCDVVNDENALTAVVNWIFAELGVS